MKKFDLETFRANPHMKLVAKYYQKDDMKPVSEYEFVMDTHLIVKDPFSGESSIVDESAETRNSDGNWSATIYMVEAIHTPGSLAAKLTKLKSGEEIHFVLDPYQYGFSVRRLSVFGADIFIARFWDRELWMYDATRGCQDLDSWIKELTGGLYDHELIFLVDDHAYIRENHKQFNQTYRLKDLRCDEEAWFISDAMGHYRVEADDERRDECTDDYVALQRAKARGIRFREDNPYCPADLIYPPTPIRK